MKEVFDRGGRFLLFHNGHHDSDDRDHDLDHDHDVDYDHDDEVDDENDDKYVDDGCLALVGDVSTISIHNS